MPNPVVHLELHTPNLARACDYYSRLLGWRPRQVGAYECLDLGDRVGGGVVECGTTRALWLPYVEVASVTKATDRAVELGGSVMLAPREGPTGWRSVVTTPDGGEVAFWRGKR